MNPTVTALKSAPSVQPNTISGISEIPGLHIVSNLRVADFSTLHAFSDFKTFIDEEIARFSLSKVGEVYHNFPGGGFTGVVCLTESHL